MAPKAQVPDYQSATLTRLAKRRRESQLDLLQDWAVPQPPAPPLGTAAARSAEVTAPSSTRPPSSLTPREELRALGLSQLQTLGFAPTRYQHVVCGRPIVVPLHIKKVSIHS